MVKKTAKNIKKGFTLIELIVVIAMLIIISTLSLNILITVLKNSLKAQITKEVKQSGDYAISLMTKMIRNATSLQSDCLDSSSSIRIKNPDGGETEFICDYVNNYLASSSAHLSPTPAPEPITSTSLSLKSASCYFSCQQPAGKPPLISISFTLEKNTTTFKAEEKISIDFHTKAALRNY